MMTPEALGQLIDEHSAGLILYARQWTAAPEDVVQNAFVKLMAQRPTPSSPAAWLFRTVRNGAIDQARADARRKKHEDQARRGEAVWFEATDGDLDPRAVERALEGLPGDERECIVMHLWGGLSFAEIATSLDASSSSVHRWYQTGLERLRERLKASCPTK